MELRDLLTIVLTTIGTIIALGTLIQALIEYRQQGKTRRSEIFLRMRSRLREDESFSNICGLLERDATELKDVPLVEKDRFLGFFEELSLLKNSGLINDEVSLYMFGYYAMVCLDSKNFWIGLNKDQSLWKAFIDFATQMKAKYKGYEYNRKRFRL